MDAIILFRKCVSRASWHVHKGSHTVPMFWCAFKNHHRVLLENSFLPAIFCTIKSQDIGSPY